MRFSRIFSGLVLSTLGFSGLAARAQTVVANIANVFNVGSAAVNPLTNTIYVANNAVSGSVTVIDGATNATVATVPAGSNPVEVAVNPATGMVYAVNQGGNSVTVIDGATNTVTTTVTVGSGPRALAINPVTDMIYVTNYSGNSVTVINGVTNVVAATIPITAGTNPYSIAVNPVTGKIYVANYGTTGNSTVSVIDGATNAVTANVTVGNDPNAIAVNPITNIVYVVNSNAAAGNTGTGSVSVIDGATNTVIASIPTLQFAPLAIALNTATNQVYVGNLTTGAAGVVSVINGATNTVVANVNVGFVPTELAVNLLTNQIYVGSQTGGVDVLNGSNNTVTATLATVSSSVSAIAVNAVTNKIYVTSQTGNVVGVIDGAVDTVTATVATGSEMGSIAVNPVTNTIFATSNNLAKVYSINGTTNAITNASASGGNLYDVLVNPATNILYLLNQNSVRVIDGVSYSVIADIVTGSGVNAGMVLDEARNKAYVAYANAGSVFVIDTVANAITNTIPLAPTAYPRAIAFNSITNTIYVTSTPPNTLTVIDGQTQTIKATITVGVNPFNVAVNSATNKIYVSNAGPGTVTVVDGATNTILKTVTVGAGSESIAANSITNRIYVANVGANTISVIDGAADTVLATLTVGTQPNGLAVDPVKNLIYVANAQSNSVSVIDGISNAVHTYALGSGTFPVVLAVNPVTGLVYAAEYGGAAVAVISPNILQVMPLITTVTGVSDAQTISTTNIFQTTNRAPSFTVGVNSAFIGSSVYSGIASAANPPPAAVYYAIDGSKTPWASAAKTTAAGANPGSFHLTLSGLSIGLHTLYAYPAYGNEDGSSASAYGIGNSPEIGNIVASTFLVDPIATTTAVTADTNPQVPGSNVTFTATVTPSAVSVPTPTGTVSFYDSSTLLGTGTLALVAGSYHASYQTSTLAAGAHSIKAVYSGDTNYFGSTSSTYSESIQALPTVAPTITFTVSAKTYGAAPFTVTATSNSTGAFTYTVVSGNATISNGNKVTLTGVGSVTLKATEAADANYISGSKTATFTVATATPTITFTIPNHTFNDAPFTVGATSNSTGAFTYTITSGNATISGKTITLTGIGTVSVKASEAAATNYKATTKTVSFTVAKAVPIIVFAVANKTFGAAAFTVKATSNSAGAFTYSVMSGPATIAGTKVTLTGAGTVVLKVAQAASGNYLAGTQTATFTVAGKAPTITFTIAGKTFGAAPFTVAATSNSAGAFTYTVTSGPATVSGHTVTLTGAGTVKILATEAANGNYAAGTQTATFTVAAATPTITFTVANKTFGVAPFAVAATSNSTGAFTYTITSGPATVSGNTVTLTGVGTVKILASEAATTNYKAATKTATFTVSKGTPVITFAVANRTFTAVPFAIAATSTSTGAFTYTITSGPATISGKMVTLTGTGTVKILASEAATTNYNAATKSVSVTISKGVPTIVFAVANHTFGDAPFTVAATSNSTGAFTYSRVSGNATVSGHTVTLTGSGSVTLKASQAAAGNYAAGTQNVTFTVAAATLPTIAFAVANHTFGDAPFSVAATSNSPGAFTYSVVSGPATVSGHTVTLTGAGTVMLQASQAASAPYAAGTKQVSFTVAKATPTIVWPTPASVSYGTVLSGTQLNAAATGVGGAALTGTYTYTPMAGTSVTPPSQTISLLFTPSDTNDYLNASGSVTLNVTTAPLTVAANNTTRVYGAANPVFTGAINGQQNNDNITESFSTTAIPLSPVGSYAIVPAAAGAHLADYAQTIHNGTLTVTQAGTGLTLAVGAQSVIAGQNNTYTARVTSLTSGTPTGTVQFLDNGSSFGSASLVNGQAVLTSAALAAGAHTITVTYSGDSNFLPNTSSSSTVHITVTLPDFTLALNTPSTVSMLFGGSASFTFHLTPQTGSYYRAVSFSYTGELPLAATAGFSPDTIAANAGPTDVTFTIATKKLAWYRNPAGQMLFCLILLPLASARRIRRNKRMFARIATAILLLVAGVGASLGVTGCGSGYAANAYPITITANSGGVIHSAVITVQIEHTPQ